MSKEKKLRVWWIPQVPMKSFVVAVDSVEEAAKVLKLLSDYDRFQFDNNVKSDYCNVGGLQEFDPDDHTYGSGGAWVDWCDDETGIYDPSEFVDYLKNQETGVTES